MKASCFALNSSKGFLLGSPDLCPVPVYVPARSLASVLPPNFPLCRSMNTRSTSSAWTKTAWCTRQSLWSSPAPTPCGRSSVWDCTAPSAAGLTPGSSGRSPHTTTWWHHRWLPSFCFCPAAPLHVLRIFFFRLVFAKFCLCLLLLLSSLFFHALHLYLCLHHFKVQKQCGYWPPFQPWQV